MTEPKRKPTHPPLLFLMGFMQVFLVALNTWQISHNKAVGTFFVGYLISAIWVFNVRGVVVGSFWAGQAYALGAGLGSLFGLWLGGFVYGR